MFINSYFPTVIWSEEKPEFVKSLNKVDLPTFGNPTIPNLKPI